MSLDLRTISTDEADRKLALRAEAYQAGNATNLDEQVADYIRQVEEVLEVRGVNRLEWLRRCGTRCASASLASLPLPRRIG